MKQLVELSSLNTDLYLVILYIEENYIKMEQEITSSVKVLNGFLSLMVVVLVGILLSVLVSLILWSVGFF